MTDQSLTGGSRNSGLLLEGNAEHINPLYAHYNFACGYMQFTSLIGAMQKVIV